MRFIERYDLAKSKKGTSIGNDVRLQSRGTTNVDGVGHTCKSSDESLVGSTTEVVAGSIGISAVGGVQGTVDVREDVVLNQKLSALTSIDTIITRLEVVVDNMAGTKAERWCTGVKVFPVVMFVGNSQMAFVLSRIGVRVTNKRCLPVVVEIAVRNCDPIATVGNVDETIIVVLGVLTVSRIIKC